MRKTTFVLSVATLTCLGAGAVASSSVGLYQMTSTSSNTLFNEGEVTITQSVSSGMEIMPSDSSIIAPSGPEAWIEGADCTHLITNPGFTDQSGEGWSWLVSGNLSLNKSGGSADTPCAETWTGSTDSGFMFDVNQEISGLPEGVYSLTVDCFYRNGSYNSYDLGYEVPAFIYINDAQAPVCNIVSPTSGNPDDFAYQGGWVYCDSYGIWVPNDMTSAGEAFAAGMYRQKVYAIVSDGKAQIGIAKNTPTDVVSSWCIWSNFKLTYEGKNIDALDIVIRNTLNSLFSFENSYYNVYMLDHIESAQKLLEEASWNDDADEKLNMIKEANEHARIAKKIASLVDSYDAAMNKLNKVIEEMGSNLSNSARDEYEQIQYTDIEFLNYDELYALVNRISALTEQARIPDYSDYSDASDDNPVNMTTAIKNASFETGTLEGWNCYYGSDTKVADNTDQTYLIGNADGNFVFNTWDSSTPADGFYLSQVVRNLPAGTYRLTALAASDQGNVISMSAKATTAETAQYNDTLVVGFDKSYGQDMSLLFIVNEGEDIEIKMNSETWFKADNFRLTYYGPDSKKDPAADKEFDTPDGYNLITTYDGWTSDNKGVDGSTSEQQWKISSLGENDIISFDYEVSSEGDCDWLTIKITNPSGEERQLARASGNAMNHVNYTLSVQGQYILTASYSKDGSVNTGTDLGHISNIRHFAVDVLKSSNEYLASIEEAYPGLAAELYAAIDEAGKADDESRLEALQQLGRTTVQIREAIACHNNIIELIDKCDSLKESLTEDYPEFDAALAAAEALDVNTATSQVYEPVYNELSKQFTVANASILPMEDWAFNTSNEITIDGVYKYYIDTTNKVAQFNGFRSSNAVNKLVIPETINVDGNDYAVVAMENRYSYTQDSISEAILPNTLRRIGQNAFYYYRNLRTLDIPASVSVIGSQAFYCADNLQVLTLHSSTPIVCENNLGGNTKKMIIVPDGSFHAYRLDSQWGNYIIQTETPTEVNVTVATPGELGRLAIDQAGYIQEVNKLVVSGELNSDDWNTIKSMTNLISIDMEGVLNTSIPNNQFNGKWAIEKVVLPKNTVTIGSYAFYDISRLADVRLSKTLETIGSYAFYGTKALRTIDLPESLKTINGYAFCNSGLETVTIPSGVTTISSSLFQECYRLENVQLHDGITSIASNAFYNNTSLKNIKLPESLNTIGNSAFSYTAIDTLVCPAALRTIEGNAFSTCKSLVDIQLNEGLQTLKSYAFGYCTGLTEATLPSSLRTCESPFAYCSNLKKLYARPVIPATTNGNCPISNVQLNDAVLYVPVFSLQDYQLAEGWNKFYTYETYDYLPENIVINKSYTFSLREDLPEDYRPNIDLSWSDHQADNAYGERVYETGCLTINNMSKLAVNDFSMFMSPYAKTYKDGSYYWSSEEKKYNNTPLIVNGEMRAENVTINLMAKRSKWQFISFPFDVLMKDIVPADEITQWVIREYSGDNRANNKLNETWVNVPADGTLKAGKGYILHCYNPNANNDLVLFTVSPLKESVNRQAIFLATDRKVALEENLSEFEHNRSWNLIGNPYPSYYDTRFLDFEAPITVWNNSSNNYQAYSPMDDEYILSPGEAFFVQRPVEQEEITFDKAGRQIDTHARIIEEAETKAARKAPAARSNRHIININLSGEDMADRTRVVINEAASMNYELNRDASKFMSDDANATQIFSINGGVRYAINERPADNNQIVLGVRVGKDGSYSISLPENSTDEFVIEDRLTGAKATLNAESPFTFIAEPGDEEARFVLYLKPEGTTGIDGMGAETADEDGTPAFNVAGQAINEKTADGIIIKKNRKVIK